MPIWYILLSIGIPIYPIWYVAARRIWQRCNYVGSAGIFLLLYAEEILSTNSSSLHFLSCLGDTALFLKNSLFQRLHNQ
jgi:hypothetical protein